MAALHATKHESGWVECDGKVSYELHNWQSTASYSLIPGIVEAGVPVMIFAGAEDLICNYKGLELMLEHMEWNGQLGMGVSRFPKQGAISTLTLAECDNAGVAPEWDASWLVAGVAEHDLCQGTLRAPSCMLEVADPRAQVLDSSHMVRMAPGCRGVG